MQQQPSRLSRDWVENATPNGYFPFIEQSWSEERQEEAKRFSLHPLGSTQPASTMIKLLLQNWVNFYGNCCSHHGRWIHPPPQQVMGLPGNADSQAWTQAQWTRAALNDVPRWWEGLQLRGTAINDTTVLTLSQRWLCTNVESIYDINTSIYIRVWATIQPFNW